MLETLKDKYEDLRDGAENMGMPGRTNGRNAGIGPVENVLAFAAAAGAGFLARQALQGGWQAAFDRDPPKNPSSHEVDWRDAMLWGAVSGALVGVARIASRRASSSAYKKFRS